MFVQDVLFSYLVQACSLNMDLFIDSPTHTHIVFLLADYILLNDYKIQVHSPLLPCTNQIWNDMRAYVSLSTCLSGCVSPWDGGGGGGCTGMVW